MGSHLASLFCVNGAWLKEGPGATEGTAGKHHWFLLAVQQPADPLQAQQLPFATALAGRLQPTPFPFFFGRWEA